MSGDDTVTEARRRAEESNPSSTAAIAWAILDLADAVSEHTAVMREVS